MVLVLTGLDRSQRWAAQTFKELNQVSKKLVSIQKQVEKMQNKAACARGRV